MTDRVYFESQLANHPALERCRRRFPRARFIECASYRELFNRKSQNFRLQKQRPALILAEKTAPMLLPSPAEYAVGGQRHFYFSHLLNCPFDCRYCFLQGMYRSAHYVWFVNHEDFRTAIREQADASPTEDVWFFSGYDCDSLALDAVTGFCADFVPFFQQLPNAWLELRSKSAQTAMLERLPPSDRCVVAYSFTPQALSDRLEPGVPALEKRVRAMQRLTTLGWPLGLRFDPLIYDHDYRHHYGGLFEQLFSRLQADRLHSVSLGALRMPRAFFKTIHRLYPEERLFAGPLRDHQGMIGYRADIEEELRNFCLEQLRRHVPEEKLFPCW